MLGELSPRLFDSFARTGHRTKAESYVRGLLAGPGRKTLRSIADQFGGAAAPQRVHHFISESPWEWMPVRRALAGYVQQVMAPEAWVFRPTVIPKGGEHSIGVDQHYLPHLGQTVNGQQAVGGWLASRRCAVPVDWRLLLSGRWLRDPLRERVGIPDAVTAETLEECVREMVNALVGPSGGWRGPVVVDAEGVDAMSLARHFSSADLMFLVRIHPEEHLRLDRTELPKFGDHERGAAELAASFSRMRQQVHTEDGPTTAVAIPVVAPLPASRVDGMTLVGEWSGAHPRPQRLWLTSAHTKSLPKVLRLSRLPDVVERDFTDISDHVGMRDFVGRSFPGWHRHVTLASIAHLVAALVKHAGTTVAGETAWDGEA
ncbi:transposase [Streptomyces sp. TRM70350]|nr:transposase [Streptomyces sp. TRM70350]